MTNAAADAQRGLPFAKLQGAGNGYLAFDGTALPQDGPPGLRWSELARVAGDPHFGVGSDGVVVAQPATRPDARIRMRVFNTDGSEAEMSGNGIRLFAKFSLERGLCGVDADGALVVETGGGLRTLWPRMEGRRMRSARVAMDEPRFDLASLPAEPDRDLDSPALEVPLDLGSREITLTLLSLGNPHAVHFLGGTDASQLRDFPLEEIGTRVQNHPWFPKRTNFEVAQVLGRDRVRARIFERGEGETLASGTGSTAVAVAARLLGHVDREVEVLLAGGQLRVEWDGRGSAYLEGPTVEVFRGTWPLDRASLASLSMHR